MTKWATLACALAAAFAPGACRKAAEEIPPAETAPAAEAEPTVDIAGSYVGGGVDGEGRSYACELEVEEYRTAMYDVKRRVDGGDPIAGVAILSGTTFAVGFNDGRRYGVVAYDVGRDGSLVGISAFEGGARVGTEKLTRKPNPP